MCQIKEKHPNATRVFIELLMMFGKSNFFRSHFRCLGDKHIVETDTSGMGSVAPHMFMPMEIA